jgi:hypothetical protein
VAAAWQQPLWYWRAVGGEAAGAASAPAPLLRASAPAPLLRTRALLLLLLQFLSQATEQAVRVAVGQSSEALRHHVQLGVAGLWDGVAQGL